MECSHSTSGPSTTNVGRRPCAIVVVVAVVSGVTVGDMQLLFCWDEDENLMCYCSDSTMCGEDQIIDSRTDQRKANTITLSLPSNCIQQIINKETLSFPIILFPPLRIAAIQ